MSARPRPPAKRPGGAGGFKKTSPRWPARQSRGQLAGKPIEIWFQDEARVGQQGTLTGMWARRGTAPADRARPAVITGPTCSARSVRRAASAPRSSCRRSTARPCRAPPGRDQPSVATGAIAVLSATEPAGTARRSGVPTTSPCCPATLRARELTPSTLRTLGYSRNPATASGQLRRHRRRCATPGTPPPPPPPPPPPSWSLSKGLARRFSPKRSFKSC